MARVVTLVTGSSGSRLELLRHARERVCEIRAMLASIEQLVPDTDLGIAARTASESLDELVKCGSPVRRTKPPTIKPDRKSNALPRGDRQ